MAEVYPIENFHDIKRIRKELTSWGKTREAELFWIGCHLGLRVSDMIWFTFEDMKNKSITVNENKTGKQRKIFVTPIILESVERLKNWYAKEFPFIEVEFLFQATGPNVKTSKHVTKDHVRKVIKEVCEHLGMEDNFGTHTMRKTFGFHLYKKTKDINLVQKILNHASASETLGYIGVTGRKLDEALMAMDFR